MNFTLPTNFHFSRMACLLFLLLASQYLLPSCQKSNDEPSPPSRADLLTKPEWQLRAAGFDDDSSGVLEPNENELLPCQLDNSLQFLANGTGTTLDNSRRCDNIPAETSFTWIIPPASSRLEISGTPMEIKLLNEERMILAFQEFLIVPYLVEYDAKY